MMNDETKRWGMRILHGAHQESSSQSSNSFDERVFWVGNFILIAVTVATLVWCVCGGFESLSRYISSGMSSDQVYRERIIRRQQQRSGQDQEKKETPEQRRTNLLQSFHRNKVHSIVQHGDFVEESMAENKGNAGVEESHGDALNAMETGAQVVNETIVPYLAPSTAEAEPEDFLNTREMCANEFMVETLKYGTSQDEHDQAMNDLEMCAQDANESMVENTNYATVKNLEDEVAQEDEHNVTMTVDPVELHVETGEPGCIKLRTVGGNRTVPNCCAVCLCTYEPGESIVWSSTKECPHAFHEECILEWLIKMQDGTPCPCCRQEFVDVSLYNERKT